MKRPYLIVKNTSKWPTDVLTVLFDLAWDVTWKGKDPIQSHPHYCSWHSDEAKAKSCVYNVKITHTSRTARGRAWTTRCLIRLGYGVKTWPRRLNYAKWKDMPEYEARNWYEMIIHIAAHEFAHLTGYDGNKAGEEMCELCAWDAIDAYRKRQAEIDAKIDDIRLKADLRVLKAHQQALDTKAERNSPEYKLARLEAKEKVWLRKLRLALSKMKSIKRSRAAIIRWQDKKADALRPMAEAANPGQP